MYKKKSQVTVFIIIGIILLACVSFVFFYLSLETDQDSSKEDTGLLKDALTRNQSKHYFI